MKTISQFLLILLFLIFFITTFIVQKTIVFYTKDCYYCYITYTRNIHDLAHSLRKPYILWKLEENHPYDQIYEGMLIKLKAPLHNSK
jgi:hypothetical protein